MNTSQTRHTSQAPHTSQTFATSQVSGACHTPHNSYQRVIHNFIDTEAAHGIILDTVQKDALYALADNHDVLMSAPTGSGKTMIALGAVELACARSQRCVYTAPIKALSNQKYKELCERYGYEQVGLLTGDETINRDALILVVTTEVLRNMLYVHDSSIRDIGYAVLDEVHYLADPSRGPVWEEIILQLPERARLVSLSATISNVQEFGDWLCSVRPNTTVVASTIRPVPLVQYVADGHTLAHLFDKRGAISKEAKKMDERCKGSAHPERGSSAHTRHHQRRYMKHKRIGPADRRRIIDLLDHAHMLPAIEFIFSRKGCDRAVGDLLDADIRLTTPSQEHRINQALKELRGELSDADARTVRFNFWARALRRGFAAHHAGMFPAIKHLTENLMDQGLLSLVYATGTLALGIDMPVRTVVLESLRRFNGSDFVDVTASEYTQLIGRAGRRGKDKVGNAVVFMSSDTPIEELSRVGSGRVEPLKSAFFPSYNTVVNLLRTSSYGEARTMMGTSFAQFQHNRELVGMERRASRVRKRIGDLEKAMKDSCDLGNIVEYARLYDQAGRACKAQRKKARTAYKAQIVSSWKRVEIGHIYAYAKNHELHYGIALGIHRDRLRLFDMSASSAYIKISWLKATDLGSELRDVGTVHIPFGMSIKTPQVYDQVAEDLLSATAERIDVGSDRDLLDPWDRSAHKNDPKLLAHPVHSCPDRSRHLRQTRELRTLDRELRNLHQSIEKNGESVAREFDATAQVLGYLGYIQNVPADVHRTDHTWVKLRGGATMLCGIHNENDLLITQCLSEASFNALTSAEFAGICTVFLSDRRLGESPHVLPERLHHAWQSVQRNFEFLQGIEHRYHIIRTLEPMNGGVEAFTQWAAGGDLSSILRTFRIDVGDFMAVNRRLIDLLGQIALVAADSAWGNIAAESQQSLRRWEWI